MKSFDLGPEHELLLTAALAGGDRARRAYRQWAATVSFDRLDLASQRLLPLLVANPSVVGELSDADDPVLGRCNKIVRFTWLKSRLLLAQAAPVVAGLRQLQIPVMALKGAAVIDRPGVSVAVRPMDDVDLAVPTDRAVEAIEVLAGLRFAPPVGPIPSPEELRRWFLFDHGMVFMNERGAAVDLHWHVSNLAINEASDQVFWQGGVPGRLGGEACLVTSVEHSIVSVISHAMLGSAPTLRWAADTALLVRSTGADGVDWDEVATTARRLRLEVAVGVALRRLASVVDVGVPPDLLVPGPASSLTQRLASQIERRGNPVSRTSVLAGAFMEYTRRLEPPKGLGGSGPPAGSPTPSTARSTDRAAVRSARSTAGSAAGSTARAASRFLADWWALPGRSALPRHLLGRAVTDGGVAYPELAPGREVTFNLGGDGAGYLGRGWAQPEAHGTWSTGRQATLGAELPWLERADEGVALTLHCIPFLPALRPTLRVRLEVGGRPVDRWQLTGPGWCPERRTLRLPRSLVPGRLELRLVFDYPLSPDAAGGESSGARALALSIHAMRVERL